MGRRSPNKALQLSTPALPGFVTYCLTNPPVYETVNQREFSLGMRNMLGNGCLLMASFSETQPSRSLNPALKPPHQFLLVLYPCVAIFAAHVVYVFSPDPIALLE